MAKSHVQRTLEWLRENKIKYGVSSWYDSFSRRRHDLFGVFDYVAIRELGGALVIIPSGRRVTRQLIGIQVCGSDFQPHIRKIKASPYALWWYEAGGEIWLIGWRELKSGWKSRMYKFERGDFQTAPLQPLIKASKVPDISAL